MTSRDRSESIKGVVLGQSICVICGWNRKNQKGESLVEGAHVRPFRNISDYDKADNIIGLCPNHHTEYDVGNITIDHLNNVSISKDPSDPINLKKIVGRISHIKPGYFDYHHKHVFKRSL